MGILEALLLALDLVLEQQNHLDLVVKQQNTHTKNSSSDPFQRIES